MLGVTRISLGYLSPKEGKGKIELREWEREGKQNKQEGEKTQKEGKLTGTLRFVQEAGPKKWEVSEKEG